MLDDIVIGAPSFHFETVCELIDLCLKENERRLSGYDARLLRPNFVPRLMRLVRFLMSRRSAAVAAS